MTGAERSLWRYQIVGFISLLLLIGGIGGWAYFSSIAGAVIAQSTVVVESNSKEVQHLEGGIVANLNVRNGSYVEAGEVLIRLDDTDTKANLEIINTQLYELLARRARLYAERDLTEDIFFPQSLTDQSGVEWVQRMITGQLKLFVSRRDMLAGQKAQLLAKNTQLGKEIEGLKAQMASKEKQTVFLETELNGLKELNKKGLAPITRIMSLEREYARIEGDAGQLVSEIARVKIKIGETNLAIIQIDQDAVTKVLEELREVQPKIAELFERKLSANAKLKRINIIAPRSGLVHELLINSEGSVIGPGQIVMLIVPEKDSLVLRAQVNPQDIDQISIGQQVTINFPAFSASETPRLDGEVYRIAADLTQESASVLPYYAVRIRLKEGEAKKLENQPLKPGMPAEAYIQTTMRSALSYLLKPFSDQLNRAFRE